MKKIIIGLIILIGFIYILPSFNDKVIIPRKAIRLRVIANSNKPQDQILKNEVKTSLNKNLANLLAKSTTIEESRSLLQNNIGAIEDNVRSTLTAQHKNESFTVNYGNNYFPQKTYKGVTYAEGEYESLVVTLGKGEGKNWWCVLFPPLCMLEAEENDTSDVEYQLFIKKIIDKFSK